MNTYLSIYSYSVTSTNSPSWSLYQVSGLILMPSTRSVFTHTGTKQPFLPSRSHSARVIQEPIFALATEPSPAHIITESSPVLSI